MHATYTPKHDIAYISFADRPHGKTWEALPGVLLDLDSDGKVNGIEFVNASQHIAQPAQASIEILID